MLHLGTSRFVPVWQHWTTACRVRLRASGGTLGGSAVSVGNSYGRYTSKSRSIGQLSRNDLSRAVLGRSVVRGTSQCRWALGSRLSFSLSGYVARFEGLGSSLRFRGLGRGSLAFASPVWVAVCSNFAHWRSVGVAWFVRTARAHAQSVPSLHGRVTVKDALSLVASFN